MLKAINSGFADRNQEKLYKDSLDYIRDELKLLDMRIHAQVIRQRNEQTDTVNQFKGLAVSDVEVDSLLEGERPLPKDIRKLNELLDEIVSMEKSISEKAAKSLENGINLSLFRLMQTFGLSPFEMKCIVICLAVELDRKYETLYAYLNDDINQKYPTINLLMKLLGLSIDEIPAVNSYFEPNTPLPKYILTGNGNTLDEKTSLISRKLKLNERILDYILGSPAIDIGVSGFTQAISPVQEPEMLINLGTQEMMREFFYKYFQHQGQKRKTVVCYLSGPAGSGRKTQVKSLCGFFNKILLVVDLKKMINNGNPLVENLSILEREAILLNAVVCFDHFEVLLNQNGDHNKSLVELISMIKSLKRVTFLSGTCSWKPIGLLDRNIYIGLEFNVPHENERRYLWEKIGSNYEYTSDVQWGELAGKFSFTAGQIENALAAAQNLALYRHPSAGRIETQDIYMACYAQAGHNLDKKATKVVPRYEMKDIIVPSEGKQLLTDICNQVKYRHIVYGDWGFDKKLAYGKGLSAIFSGPPGTGKTMAAQIIARELQLEIYKIDLSQVMSKYIGETEKNLQEIFDEAQLSNAILFFDEADALFGKRSEVKDARDRYANIETAYLLQKMEDYSGLTILATNLIGNIDDAFMRRIQFVVEFPFPDAEIRQKIWRVIFPQEAPLSDDIDYEFLGETFEISGGNIKNIAVAAAFYAAEASKSIGMEHIIRAAKYELKKIGKIYLSEKLGEYNFS